MTRAEQLRAGRAYNRMNDVEAGCNDQASDPTGEMGWMMLTVSADRQANWDERTYEEILAAKAEAVLAWENAS